MEKNRNGLNNSLQMKSLIVLFSYHHNNTEKIAKVIAKVLNAEIKTPQQINPEELQDYDLIGFGSGIYGGRHHKSILELVDKLFKVTDRKAFLFSTSGATGKSKVAKDHSFLKGKLQSKGYIVVDEFQCKGFFGIIGLGLNRGRPNAGDLKCAKKFAQNLTAGQKKI
jgi:flavodoxin